LTTPISRLLPVLALLSMLLGCGGQLNLANLDSRELFQIGMEKYEKKRYVQAIESFQAVVFNYPGEPVVDSAQYYLALSYFGQKSYVLAQVEFNRLILNYPSSVFAPQAQLMKAVSFFKGTPDHYGLDQTDLQTAVRQFEDFILDYPESDAIPEARVYLQEARSRLGRKRYQNGITYVRLHDYRAARIYFQSVIDEFTDTDYAALATYQMADTYLEDKQWDSAFHKFDNFRIVFADHEWAGMATARACESALKGGEAAMEHGDTGLARTRFERYLGICGGDDEDGRKVSEYLDQIGEAPVVEVDSTHAGS
jgi:outer membrane protein assembly factor BamD